MRQIGIANETMFFYFHCKFEATVYFYFQINMSPAFFPPFLCVSHIRLGLAIVRLFGCRSKALPARPTCVFTPFSPTRRNLLCLWVLNGIVVTG